MREKEERKRGEKRECEDDEDVSQTTKRIWYRATKDEEYSRLVCVDSVSISSIRQFRHVHKGKLGDIPSASIAEIEKPKRKKKKKKGITTN